MHSTQNNKGLKMQYLYIFINISKHIVYKFTKATYYQICNNVKDAMLSSKLCLLNGSFIKININAIGNPVFE